MKRFFLLICLIPALLLCSCDGAATTDPTAAPAPEKIDEPQLLLTMAKEATMAYGHGDFEDVEAYMLYTTDEQMTLLFPGQTAPYQYGEKTFASAQEVMDQVRSALPQDISLTITDTQLELFPDPINAPDFMKMTESALIDVAALGAEMAAKATVTVDVVGGETPTNTIEVYFVRIDGHWKICSPTVAGYFLQLYATNTQ